VIEILSLTAATLGPILAGLIASRFGLTSLFLLAAVIVFFCIIAIMMIKDFEIVQRVGWLDFWDELKSHKKESVAFAGLGGDNALRGVVWPIFLLLLFTNYEELGIFAGGITLLAGVVTLVVGRLTDKYSKEKIELVGTTFVGLTWVGKMFAGTLPGLFLLDSMYKIFYSSFLLPVSALTYSHGFIDNKPKFVLFRELSIACGAIGMLLVLYIMLVVKLPYEWIFGLGLLSAIAPLVLMNHPRIRVDLRNLVTRLLHH
jgi:MFS family permease